jgi:hypothetical protein
MPREREYPEIYRDRLNIVIGRRIVREIENNHKAPLK